MFRRANVMIAIGCLIITLGAGNAWRTYKTYHNPLDTVYTSTQQLDKNNSYIPMIQPEPTQPASDLSPSEQEDPSGYPVSKQFAATSANRATVQAAVQVAPRGLVPDRIVISAINLDAPIVPIHYINVSLNGQEYQQWIAPNHDAAGWQDTSALLGLPGNTVLNGHHNAYGKVFENLIRLNVGDTITVYSGSQAFEYKVAEKLLLPERFESIRVRMDNARWIMSSNDERLTLITCWPADSNTHRVVIVAFPITK